MGLPLWRDPDEKSEDKKSPRPDPTAAARSSIRRRPSIHGRRTHVPLQTDSRVRRRPYPDSATTAPPQDPPRIIRRGTTRGTTTRDGTTRGVPSIATLLESADPDPHPQVVWSRTPLALPPSPDSLSRSMHRGPDEEQNLEGGHRASHQYEALQEHQRQMILNTEAPRWVPLIPRNARITGQGTRQTNATPLSSVSNTEERTETSAPNRESGALVAPHRDDRNGFDRLYTPDPASEDNTQPSERYMDPFLEAAERLVAETRRARQRSIQESSSEPTPLPSQHDRGLHPLRHSWRPGSPVDGLGDRNRSPTPADGWEIMRTTITPDSTLPSAESSFASAAASDSFGSAYETNPTDTDTPSDNASPPDYVEYECDPADVELIEAFAVDMYFHDMSTHEGRMRLVNLHRAVRSSGHVPPPPQEPDNNYMIDMGLRLMESALESEEGRERLTNIGFPVAQQEEIIHLRQIASARRHHLRTRAHNTQSSAPASQSGGSSRPLGFSGRGLTLDRLRSIYRARRDEQGARQGVPGTARTEANAPSVYIGRQEISGSTLRAMVETLASRDDVPNDWWNSLGLHRMPRGVPSAGADEPPVNDETDPSRNGRGDRGESRL